MKTNLPNFRHFQEAFSLLASEHEASGKPLTLAVIDVDDFKRLNSTIGHPLADRVLEQLGEMLQNCIRLDDLLARYGGEEFILVLPGSDRHAAAVMLERIRQRGRTALLTWAWMRIPCGSR